MSKKDLDTQLNFGKAIGYGARRMDINTLIVCRIFCSNKADIVLPVHDIAKTCGAKSKTNVLREIKNFINRGLIRLKEQVKSNRSIHFYNIYERIAPESEIEKYNHEVIDLYNKGELVKSGKQPTVSYVNFGKEICMRANLLLRLHAPRNLEKSNAKTCKEMTDSGIFNDLISKAEKYSKNNPELECNGWIKEGRMRLSNKVCNTSSDFEERIREIENMTKSNLMGVQAFDSNASIIRTAHFLVNDRPAPLHMDIYKLLIEKVAEKYNSNPYFAEILTTDGTFRKRFKTTVLPVFMRDYSIDYMARTCSAIQEFNTSPEIQKEYVHLDNYMNVVYGIKFKSSYLGCHKVISGLIYDLTGNCNPNYEDYLSFYKTYRQTLINYCHSNLFRNEIFVWESAHHIYMLDELTNMGYKVYNIYDEELIVGDIGREKYEEIWLRCAEKTKKKYHQWIAYLQQRDYSPEKVKAKCDKMLAKQEKIKKEIEKIMEEYNQPFYFAEQMYLEENNMYKKGYVYVKRRKPRAKCVKDLF